MRVAIFSLAAVALIAGRSSAAEMPVVYADDFENGMDHWEPMGGEPSFAVVELKGPAGETTKALRALGTSKYQPEYRSPPNIALLKDVTVSDLEITAKVQSTNVNAGAHRDMCIVWGYQDANHFYYVHFGAAADPHACQIFVVDNAARLAITTQEAKGTPWTEGWHTVKVVRNAADGTMEVYFDDMEKPFMAAKDERFKWGRVGLGTFDDNGNWDEFELRGVKVVPAATIGG
jgi:hypothetical protein